MKNPLKYNFIVILILGLVLVTSDAELYFGFNENPDNTNISLTEPCGDMEHAHSHHHLLLDLFSGIPEQQNIPVATNASFLFYTSPHFIDDCLKSIWQPPEIS